METSKSQVDRLGERLKAGSPDEADLRLLDSYRASFDAASQAVVAVIRDQLHLEPAERTPKTIASIVAKLQREETTLSRMRDIAGCRLVVEDIPAQDSAVAALNTVYHDSAKVVDRRVRPNHGYRAVHVIVKSLGRAVEIQVRTNLQHVWAEFSERVSQDLGLGIKYGGGPAWAQAELINASKLVADIESLELQMFTQLQSAPPRNEWTEDIERDVERFRENVLALRQSLPRALEFIRMRIASGAGMMHHEKDEGNDAVSH